ncbi:MAG: aminotransferase family protein [Anaerocolumna sp.]|jgi:aminotransferase in exopolysaccharide biosynthesis|nr:aminotransferase family protein [Anaerocolumna sp.]
MEGYIPLSVPNIKGNEWDYVKHALETEWVSTAGAYITEFEKKISDYTGMEDAVACQSGTAGLHLALKVLGITENDEVIVPSLTFIAAVNPVKYVGAEPVFIDCDDYLTLDSVKLTKYCEEQCSYVNGILRNKLSGKQIKAIIVVHVFGNIADMSEIMDIAAKYQLKVIEDATEALGSYYTSGKYKGKHAGTIGDIGVYSFNGNKIITTGGGGMIVSNNQKYLDRCRYLSTQAKDDSLYFVHEEIGYNYRMTNLQAALGLAQLERLEEFIETKKENYHLYIQLGIKLLPFRENIRPNYWFYSYCTNNRDDLLKKLEQQRIQTRPIWKLIHTLTPYRVNEAHNISKATDYYDRVLNIPCSSNLTKDQVKLVANAILNTDN